MIKVRLKFITAALLCAALLPACSSAPSKKELQLVRLAREADASYQTGDLDRAKNQYETLLKENPNFGTAHVRLGAIAYRRGDDVLARRQFQLALQRDPKNDQAAYNLAMLSLNDAAALLTKYLQLAPGNQDRARAQTFLTAIEEFGSRPGGSR